MRAKTATGRIPTRRGDRIGTPGNTRHFTVAVADCGSAFSACPPFSIVATQVVRTFPTCCKLADSTSAAAMSSGSAANFAIASPSGPDVTFADSLKLPIVQLFHVTGKR
jgi:hypothetical protein